MGRRAFFKVFSKGLSKTYIINTGKASISLKRDPLNILEVSFQLASFKTLISESLEARITIVWNPICQ